MLYPERYDNMTLEQLTAVRDAIRTYQIAYRDLLNLAPFLHSYDDNQLFFEVQGLTDKINARYLTLFIEENQDDPT